MRRKVLALIVVGLLVAAGSASNDADKKDKDPERILGNWGIVSQEKGREKVSEEKYKDITVIFAAGGKLTLKEAGKELELTFKLRPAKSPKEIDVTGTKDGKDEVHKGIYVLDKDDLKICISAAPADRPKEFATQAGDSTELSLLKRQKN